MKGGSLGSILAVDDNDYVLDAVSFILGGEGYHVVVSPNAEEGIVKFKNNDFDVVLTDIRMPDFSGMECSGPLRQDKKTSCI